MMFASESYSENIPGTYDHSFHHFKKKSTQTELMAQFGALIQTQINWKVKNKVKGILLSPWGI